MFRCSKQWVYSSSKAEQTSPKQSTYIMKMYFINEHPPVLVCTNLQRPCLRGKDNKTMHMHCTDYFSLAIVLLSTLQRDVLLLHFKGDKSD